MTSPPAWDLQWGSMNSTGIDRRRTLALLLAAAFRPGTALAGRQRPLYLAACSSDRWSHEIRLLDEDGAVLARFDLADRGHGAAVAADGRRAVVFARRPGTFAAVIDVAGRSLERMIASRPDRHFYGHGCFSADGRLLYATENDFDNERGVLGVYDAAARFERVGELPSHGIGPHEMVLMPDGETAAVANGGVLTHPSMPRIKLNVADMTPSLALVRLADGALLARHEPDPALHQLSIRHLSASPAGDLAFAMQWQGDVLDQPPLVGVLRPSQRVRFLRAPDAVQAAMRNYCGSVAHAEDGGSFLVSCPRGGVLTRWSASGEFIAAHPFTDGSAIAPLGDGDFLVTNGQGVVGRLGRNEQTPSVLARHEGVLWDNHLSRIG